MSSGTLHQNVFHLLEVVILETLIPKKKQWRQRNPLAHPLFNSTLHPLTSSTRPLKLLQINLIKNKKEILLTVQRPPT